MADVKTSLKETEEHYKFVKEAYINKVYGHAMGLLEKFRFQVQHEISLRDHNLAFREQELAQQRSENCKSHASLSNQFAY